MSTSWPFQNHRRKYFSATTVAAHMRNTGLPFHERRRSRLSFHLGAIVVVNKQLSCALECAKRNAQNISIVTECHTGCHTAGQRQSRRLSQTAQPMPAQPSARRAPSSSNCVSQSLIWRLHAPQVSLPSTTQIWDVTGSSKPLLSETLAFVCACSAY